MTDYWANPIRTRCTRPCGDWIMQICPPWTTTATDMASLLSSLDSLPPLLMFAHIGPSKPPTTPSPRDGGGVLPLLLLANNLQIPRPQSRRSLSHALSTSAVVCRTIMTRRSAVLLAKKRYSPFIRGLSGFPDFGFKWWPILRRVRQREPMLARREGRMSNMMYLEPHRLSPPSF